MKAEINRRARFMRRMSKDRPERRVYWERQHHKLFHAPLPFFSLPVKDDEGKIVIKQFRWTLP